jgi:hypothetical protein
VIWIPVPAGDLRVRLHINEADEEPSLVDIVLPGLR